MLLIKLIIVSSVCLVCCTYTINGSTTVTINTSRSIQSSTNNNNNNNNNNNSSSKSNYNYNYNYNYNNSRINRSNNRIKQDNKRTANGTIKESNIYNIKRLLPAKATRPIISKIHKTKARKTKTTTAMTIDGVGVEATQFNNIEKMRAQQQQQQQQLENEQQQQQKYEQKMLHYNLESNSIGNTLMGRMKETSAAIVPFTRTATTIFERQMAPTTQQRNSLKMKKFKNVSKNSHKLNKKMLNKLGFTKVKAPNSHNRKRLAIESRHHASPDDSHMFIIKLPPNMHYYSNPKASDDTSNGINNIGKPLANSGAAKIAASYNALIPNLGKKYLEDGSNDIHENKVSFPFNSNGKPGRIYHWNLPIIEKILQDKKHFPNITNTEQLIDIKNIPTWSKPWENEAIEKSFGQDALASYKKTLKPKSPTYYAPANTVNKNSFNKYFSGNGKPKGFYVIKENLKKPIFYKHIIT